MVAIVVPIPCLLLYFGYDAYQLPSQDGGCARRRAADHGRRAHACYMDDLHLRDRAVPGAWGAYELFPGEAGAGGGQGPAPVSVALPADAASALPVQVIGQQWTWTYRYPPTAAWRRQNWCCRWP